MSKLSYSSENYMEIVFWTLFTAVSAMGLGNVIAQALSSVFV